MSENTCSNVGGIVAAFAAGALIGAGVALLMAPRSGKETRELLSQRTRDLKDKAKDAVDHARGAITDRKNEIVAAVEAAQETLAHEHARHAKA